MIDNIISKLESYISIVGNSLSIMMFGRDGAANTITSNINEKKRWNEDDMLVESLRLTNMMTSLFNNTKVQVFVYKSDKPNAFTFPGEPVLGPYKQTMWIAGVTAARLRLNPLIFVIFLVLMNVEKLKNALLHGAFLIRFNESTKKIDISIKNVTCYVASSLVDMMAIIQ